VECTDLSEVENRKPQMDNVINGARVRQHTESLTRARDIRVQGST